MNRRFSTSAMGEEDIREKRKAGRAKKKTKVFTPAAAVAVSRLRRPAAYPQKIRAKNGSALLRMVSILGGQLSAVGLRPSSSAGQSVLGRKGSHSMAIR